jgi:hypothetical protein
LNQYLETGGRKIHIHEAVVLKLKGQNHLGDQVENGRIMFNVVLDNGFEDV